MWLSSASSAGQRWSYFPVLYWLIMARSPPMQILVLRASVHFRGWDVDYEETWLSRRTQPSGQVGLVTEKSDQTGVKISEFKPSGSYLSRGQDLSLSQTSKNCLEPLLDLIWNYNAIYLYQTESILPLISFRSFSSIFPRSQLLMFCELTAVFCHSGLILSWHFEICRWQRQSLASPDQEAKD